MEALGKERDEGGIEGALGKQPAKQIGNAEGDEKGVGHGGGAEHGGDQNVADEAEHTASDGDGADGGEAADELHQAGCSACSCRACRAFRSRSRMALSRLLLVIFLPVRSVT